MLFIQLIASILLIWVYQMLYDDEPWYEHVIFWAFAVGLAVLWLFG